jgi:hypothetical protein
MSEQLWGCWTRDGDYLAMANKQKKKNPGKPKEHQNKFANVPATKKKKTK